MSRKLVVARHEFFTTIRRKGYILSAFVMPLLVFLPLLFLMNMLPGMISDTPDRIGFVDYSGLLEGSADFDGYEFVEYFAEDDARDLLLSGELLAVFVVPENYTSGGTLVVYSTGGLFGFTPSDSVYGDFFRENLLLAEGLDEPTRNLILAPTKNLETITLTETGDVEPEREGSVALLPIIIATVLMLAILTSSGYLLQGVVAEKENKTIEVLLSSLSATDLLYGKILGFGAAGLLQTLIWILMGIVVSMFSPLAVLFSGINFSGMLVLGLVYFILGFLLFSSSMACVAAPSENAQYAQQTASIFSLFAILPVSLSSFILESPNSLLVKFLSIFPYTSPTVSLVRMSAVSVSPLEIAASLIVLAISVILVMKLSAKLFHSSVLLRGGRVGPRELVRMLRRSS